MFTYGSRTRGEPLILEVDPAGTPRRWLLVEEAITYHAKHQVAWSIGTTVRTYHGGLCRTTGERSELSTASIIAIKGSGVFAKEFQREPALINAALFVRDRQVCAYCGDRLRERELSRDHIVPISRGGLDRWMNVVTACRSCNSKKDNRTPESARMPLLYLPYVPNRHEHMILQNRRILADQMEYLMARVPRHSRLHA
ncbi:MAG: HNH endonuclease [Proteobacteria bacterium]|nr:HNH endonuclease [Burkholderiales bacterium]